MLPLYTREYKMGAKQYRLIEASMTFLPNLTNFVLFWQDAVGMRFVRIAELLRYNGLLNS